MNRASLCLAAALALAAGPAFADAVTYTGTLGGKPIVMELTQPKDGTAVGRYSYMDKGVDIPLYAVGANKYDTVLSEGVPCTAALCLLPDGNLVTTPPMGGQFNLHYSAGNTKLTGTWRAAPGVRAELEVDLDPVGSRSYERHPDYLYADFLWKDYRGEPITPTSTPYDYAKLQVQLKEGPLVTVDGATYRDVVDPRTKFPFPRVVSLPGGGDVAPVNAMLDQQRWGTSFSALECAGQNYLDGGWDAQRVDNGYSPLGDFDQESISVDYLSATVMTIGQGGSVYCGGASPHNHIDYYTYDVRKGGPLHLSRIFKGWDAATNKPDQALIDWVIAAYPKTSDYDADYAAECEINENFATHLDIGFAQGDFAVFLIGGIDQAACMGAMVTVPLADIRDLLTDAAIDYFPSLRQ